MTSGRLDLPEITTPRLRLGALEVGDAADLTRLTADPAILSAIDILPNPFTMEDARALIRRGDTGREIFLGGRLVAGGGLALVCGVHLEGEAAVEIGYWVGVAHRRRGLAREAVAAVLLALHARHPERRAFAECRPTNVASWQLLASLGFRDHGEPGRRPGRRRLVR